MPNLTREGCCSESGCTKPIEARRLCKAHYLRQYRERYPERRGSGYQYKPKEQRVCPVDGTVFEASNNKRFCSTRCKKRWENEHYRRMYQHRCVVCETAFESVKANAKYCSTGADSCESAARSAEYRARDDIGNLPERRRQAEERRFNAVLATFTASPKRCDDAAYKRALKADPCAYCGVAPSGGIDHIEPRHIELDRKKLSNMTGCCKRCNETKRALPLLSALPWIPLSRSYHDQRRLLFAPR